MSKCIEVYEILQSLLIAIKFWAMSQMRIKQYLLIRTELTVYILTFKMTDTYPFQTVSTLFSQNISLLPSDGAMDRRLPVLAT